MIPVLVSLCNFTLLSWLLICTVLTKKKVIVHEISTQLRLKQPNLHWCSNIKIERVHQVRYRNSCSNTLTAISVLSIPFSCFHDSKKECLASFKIAVMHHLLSQQARHNVEYWIYNRAFLQFPLEYFKVIGCACWYSSNAVWNYITKWKTKLERVHTHNTHEPGHFESVFYPFTPLHFLPTMSHQHP